MFGRPAIYMKKRDPWSITTFIPHMDTPSLAFGRLIGWQMYVGTENPIYLQVWRPMSTHTYTLVTQYLHNPGQPGRQTVYTNRRVNILPGDMVGFFTPGASVIPFTGRRCKSRDNAGLYVRNQRHWTVGTTRRFAVLHPSWSDCRDYAITLAVRAKRKFKINIS